MLSQPDDGWPPELPPVRYFTCFLLPAAASVAVPRIPYTVLLLIWGGIFGIWYTEVTEDGTEDGPFNDALNNVRFPG